ncbi:MAG: class I SAM-dependent methyltransferase [Terriglobia bacterium]|jgi:SAM-dependent methyltransferase
MSEFNDKYFNEEVKGKKTEALIEVLSAHFQRNSKDILVVGCGSGREAGMLARAFKADVIGIDRGDDYTFDHQGSAPAKLLNMDAYDLKFPCSSFDMVFSFHTLEHIPEPQRALKEMSRVLRPGGVYLVGTPNKSRLIGGFTTPYQLSYKILENIRGLYERLTGRWSNEAGAHAGFTITELTDYCSIAFGTAADISDLYYRSLYKRRGTAISAIIKSGLRRVIFPCVYVAGTKS